MHSGNAKAANGYTVQECDATEAKIVNQKAKYINKKIC